MSHSVCTICDQYKLYTLFYCDKCVQKDGVLLETICMAKCRPKYCVRCQSECSRRNKYGLKITLL